MPHPLRIGILTPFLGGVYIGEVMAQVMRSVQAQGASAIAIRTGRIDGFDLPLALERVDGWIIILKAVTSEYCERLVESGRPVVTIANNFGNPLVVSVESDNESSTAQAVDELIRAGHQHIAYIGYVTEYDITCRLNGYRRALAQGRPLRGDFFRGNFQRLR